MPEFNIKPGVLVFVLRDVFDYVEFSGILAPDGTFREPVVDEYVALLDVVLKSLKDHQVELPEGVEDAVRVVKLLLPLLLSFIKRRRPTDVIDVEE